MRKAVALLVLAAWAPAGDRPQVERFPVEIRAIRDVRVPAEVSGRVLTRPKNEHAAVKAGQIIVTLDPKLLLAAVNASRAAARRAKARHEFAAIELKRVVGLWNTKSVGRAEVDLAEVTEREAKAGVESAEAKAEEFETRLERASIRAPFDGKLVRVHPKAGEYLRTGATAFRIIDDSALKIVVYVPARALARLEPGRMLRVEPDPDLAALKLPPLDARVFAVAPAAQGRARTCRVEAHTRDKSGRWRPGMTGLFAPVRGG